MTPAERSMRARIAAHTLHASGKTDTAPARRAFEKRFEQQVDPTEELPVDERRRRAAHARTAYFLKLSMKAAQARRRRAVEPEEPGSTELGR